MANSTIERLLERDAGTVIAAGGLTVAGGRVICPQHSPCPTGEAKWADVRRYGGGAARFAFVTGMWIRRGWPGAHAPLIEREFIAAHLTDGQRQTQETQAQAAGARARSRHSHARDSAEGARADVEATTP